MGEGIWAVVTFDTPIACPMVELSKVEDLRIHSVARNASPKGSEITTTEFTVDCSDGEFSEQMVRSFSDRLVPVFSYDGAVRYRLFHDGGIDCPCECIGSYGCPINRYHATEGSLTVEFCTLDFDELQEIVADLRARFPGLIIKRLIHSPTETPLPEYILVDRASLTERQIEVLETAHEMGYFDRERSANVNNIAECLDLHPSTVSEHLAAAQGKVFDQLL